MLFSNPSQLNSDRWVVLLDCKPDVGALGGFFQIATGRRTINGFTTDDPLFILKFMGAAKNTLTKVHRGAGSAHAHFRYCVCVLDRIGGGRVILHDELGALITDAAVREIYRKRNTNPEAAQKLAEKARSLAQQLVNKLPLSARPKDRLLMNESPFQAMRLSGFQWMLSRQNAVITTQNPNSDRMQRAIAAYQADVSIPQSARNNAWRMSEVIRQAYEDAKPDHIEFLKKERENTVTISDYGPTVGRGETPTIAMRMRGFDLLVDRMFRRLEVEENYMGIRGAVQSMTIQALEEGLDYNSPDKVAGFVKRWLRTNVTYQYVRNELRLPEPSDRFRPYGANKRDVLRLQLFSPMQPNVPAVDSGTIQSLRIY